LKESDVRVAGVLSSVENLNVGVADYKIKTVDKKEPVLLKDDAVTVIESAYPVESL
jgi:hypothetical protein